MSRDGHPHGMTTIAPSLADGVNDEALTIPGLALAAAARWPDAEAVIAGGTRLSFAMLADRMIAAAAAFVAAGLREGERVCLWAENSADWIVACLGLQAAGGVLVPLNTRFREGEAADIVQRSRAAMAVAAEDFLGVRHADLLAAIEAPALRRIISLGGDDWARFLAAADAGAHAEARRRVAALSPDDLSDIMFTSGTTGHPKGAMATHGQTVRTARLWAHATTIGADDRFLILWPFFHCSGYKAGWVVTLAVGAASLPVPLLEPAALLDLVARERVTFLPGPPTLFHTLLADPALDRGKLASVRVSITGATAVAPSMIEAMRRDLGIAIVLTGYGLTETCGTVTMTRPDDPDGIVGTSCGRAVAGIDIACVDGGNRPVPAGAAGEIVVRGMTVMLGYLDDPAATAEAVDAAGWFHTGDIGMIDASGYLRITDRKKDMFITGGFNCYPAEIETMLLAHPAILQVAVTGVPDDRMGEVGRAHVVLKPGATADAAALAAWSRARMANFKVPRAFVFVDTLPVTATGKVQKFKLSGA